MKIVNYKTAILIFFLIGISFLVYLAVGYTDFFEEKNSVQSLYKSCLISMKNNVCSIMLGPQSTSLDANDNQVLIAGVGNVDIKTYRQFRDNPQMCFEIKTSCELDKTSPVCRLAKSLYQPE